MPEDSTQTGGAAADLSESTSGSAAIRRHLVGLGTSPGVYRMLDARGGVLYVGKAKNLKRRVSSYAKPGGHSNRISRMIRATASMEFVATGTEAEALLLEANLIKRLKPRYNILLRDDKAFPQILVGGGHPFPRLRKHRGARRDPGDYFGPFASAGAVNRTLSQLQRAFLLRTCSDSVFANRTRPCLLHQIRRCAGPCVGLVGEREYAKQVEDAKQFLGGRSTRIQEELAGQMREASQALDFERATVFRDRIRALTEVQARQQVNPKGVEEADLFALHLEGGQGCVQAVFYRACQHWGDRAYFPRFAEDDSPAGILDAFLGQFYADRLPPRQILLSHPIERPALMEEALGHRLKRRIRILVPQRGEKRALIRQASANAAEGLARRMAEASMRRVALDAVVDALRLETVPERIEVFDSSHIQGSKPVVAMVVAGPEGFLRSQYRKFNLDQVGNATGDDLALMRAALVRRYGRLLREDPDREQGKWPDLVLIDGGAGQLKTALEVLADLGLGELPVVAIAKGPNRDAGQESFFLPGRGPFRLRRRDPALYFLQRLRDEAHRFAVGAHRLRRSRDAMRSPLDEISGIGGARKRALLERFGSSRAVGEAGLADIESVSGISRELAERIRARFREAG